VWSADDPDADPTVYTSDFGSVHFDSDRMAMTLAVVPEGTEVPLPETLDDLDRLDPTTDSVVPDDTTPVTALDGTSDTTVADTSTTTSTPEAAQ
jgi:hypothetical protein